MSTPPDRSVTRSSSSGWVAAVMTIALLVVVAVLIALTREGLQRLIEYPTPLVFAIVGAVVTSRHRSNTVGWLFLALALDVAVILAGQQVATYTLTRAPGFARWSAWTGTWTVEPLIGFLSFIFLLFPGGRLPSKRWRPVAFAAGVTAALQTLMAAISDVNPETQFLHVHHPFVLVPSKVLAPLYEGVQILGLAVLAICLGSIAFRLRAARGELREQLKWVAYAAVVAVAAIVGTAVLGVEPLLGFHLFVPAIAVAAGVAILRYRLYDIDLLINRTLVYTALTAVIAIAYVAAASLLSLLVGGATRGSPIVLAVLIALLFGLLRNPLQRAVDRLMFGDRDDPYRAMSVFGRKLETTPAPDAAMPDLARTIAEMLRLPYVGLDVWRSGTFATAASYGSLRGEPVMFPLVYGGRTVGRLRVSRRSPGEELSIADRRLLEDLARQAGVAVHAVQLAVDLQRSRERLVTTREEERRRLRRDLHDGLGPTLAGAALQLENAGGLIDRDTEVAKRLIESLKVEIQGAVADVRRLVYDLRPPALDELGLVPAIRQRATQLSTNLADASNGMTIDVDASEALAGLPAAVEVAAYRIATEAMTNSSRHAHARRCTVRLQVADGLEIEVTDDGRGLPADLRPGVGLLSIRERAEELGGTCMVERVAGGGTKVTARLPLVAP